MRLHRFPKMTGVALGLIVVAGCGSDSPTGGSGTGDTTPPSIASVTPVDVQHVQIVFTETVDKQSAESPGHYAIIEGTLARSAPAAPGQEIPVSAAVLGSDGKTVELTTSMPMQQVPYDVHVTGVRDNAGNAITGEVITSFTGTTDPDVTPPVIRFRDPAPNTTNVALGQPVWVQFSESMDYSSVLTAFQWAPASGPGTVNWTASSDDNALFIFTPIDALALSTMYTVTVGTGAVDWAGNHLVNTTWNFQTTSQIDVTPPALASSIPASGATHVSRSTNLSMTFTEPITPILEDILISPETSDGSLQWSNGGRTFTFDPDVDLLADTQYSLLIPPGGIKDLAGNGNAATISVVFTTGNAIATGSFAGTIAGDPLSSAASNPQGALVVAADHSPFVSDNFGIAGHAVVGSGGSYQVPQLPNGTYWPFAVKETNGDGQVNPELGDAIGVYGVDFAALVGEPDSVTISGGNHLTGIDFTLFDPVALAGRVVYGGTAYPGCCYEYFVGVFDTTGFNPNDPPSLNPIYGTQGSFPYQPQWWINQLDDGLEPGTYYVGAFLDIDGNTALDPGEPMGIYTAAGVPIPLTIQNGDDIIDITVVLEDPIPAAARWEPVDWKKQSSPVATVQQRVFRRAVAVLQWTVQQERLAVRR